MKSKIRIARATNDLANISQMYLDGLSLKKLGSFQNHQGFDGVMIGSEGSDYHFEFTQEQNQKAPPCNSEEALIVFYVPDANEFEERSRAMLRVGFRKVKAHNPYWDEHGITFCDPENYRIVICRNEWKG